VIADRSRTTGDCVVVIASSIVSAATRRCSYQPMREARAQGRAGYQAPGPDATTAAVFAAVDAENPPLRLLLSGGAYDIAQGVYQQRLHTWSEWEATSRSA
jgi:hypothetical protein